MIQCEKCRKNIDEFQHYFLRKYDKFVKDIEQAASQLFLKED